MKAFLLFFLCICFLSSFSKGTINKIDSLGQKQGLWIEYDSLDVEGYNVSAQIIPDSTGKSDLQYEIVTKYDLIKHRGFYSNGIKTGLWVVYNAKNRLWMKIRYDDGQRTKVEIFYSNGRLLYSCDKLDNDFFLIKEFTKKGAFVKETKKSNESVNKLSETKLYVLGF